ncbi:MAG: N-6 DNA methylase [Candidatus Poseidoniaceae archaeon]
MCDCVTGKVPEDEGSDELGFEKELWASANKLRGSMDASEYKHIVLPLVFLKYMSDAFKSVHSELVDLGEDPDDRDEYTMRGVSWVPEKGQWSNLVENALSSDIGIMIDDAMEAIEKANPELRGVLPKTFGQTDLPSRILGDVVTLIGNLDSLGDAEARSKDIIGRVYEYFIGMFAEYEKRGGGEFYTPRSVVRLLTEMLEPYGGRIYDGCCGSGGMFVQSTRFIERHSGREDLSIYGQEYNKTTWRLAIMNLAIRKIYTQNIAHGDTLREPDPFHLTLRADYTMVNPPFNIKDWGHESLLDDPRWKYGIPPKGNANYAWIQHYLHHLSEQGLAGIVMSNGSLSTTKKEEKVIREGIINDDKLDCVLMLPDKLFTNTGISACIWILANDKTDKRFRDRRGETLFIDCRGMGEMKNRTLRELTSEDVCKIACTYRTWKDKDRYDQYQDERGFCKAVTTENEIKEHEYIIVPGRYVGAPPLPDDGEPFEQKMARLTKELGEHFAESRRLEDEIRKNLGDLGFDF